MNKEPENNLNQKNMKLIIIVIIKENIFKMEINFIKLKN